MKLKALLSQRCDSLQPLEKGNFLSAVKPSLPAKREGPGAPSPPPLGQGPVPTALGPALKHPTMGGRRGPFGAGPGRRNPPHCRLAGSHPATFDSPLPRWTPAPRQAPAPSQQPAPPRPAGRAPCSPQAPRSAPLSPRQGRPLSRLPLSRPPAARRLFRSLPLLRSLGARCSLLFGAQGRGVEGGRAPSAPHTWALQVAAVATLPFPDRGQEYPRWDLGCVWFVVGGAGVLHSPALVWGCCPGAATRAPRLLHWPPAACELLDSYFLKED